jgi:thioesterase domain-containing protein
VHLYQDLALALHQDRTVVGMHVPFRYTPGVDPRPTLREVASRYVDLVRQRQPQGPYHLLGLCFGGIVAYQMGRLLEEDGQRVAMVTIIDAVLPTAIRTDRRKRLRSYAGKMARSLRSPRTLRKSLEKGSEKLVSRVRQRWPVQAPAAEPISLPIDGPEVDAEIERFAATRYRLDGELLVVRATAEPNPQWRTVRRDQGWGGRARRVRVLDVAADHLGVLEEPHVVALARALDEQTARVSAPEAAVRRPRARSSRASSTMFRPVGRPGGAKDER